MAERCIQGAETGLPLRVRASRPQESCPDKIADRVVQTTCVRQEGCRLHNTGVVGQSAVQNQANKLP
eukprot:3250714-Pyramimonas_sp.AAC.1